MTQRTTWFGPESGGMTLHEIAGEQRMDMQPIENSRALTATLTAEQWNTVLALCNEGPHRLVRPILDSLMAQLQRQSQPQMQEVPDA